MKRTQLLALSFISLFAFACNKEDAVQPETISENVSAEASLESNITSVDSYRRNLLVEEKYDKSMSEAYKTVSGVFDYYGAFYKIARAKDRSYAFNTSTEKVRAGKMAARFEMRKADAGAGVVRSEAIGVKNEANPHRWYGLSLYLPSSSWNTSSDWEIITQFWSQPDAGEASHNPPVDLYVSKGRMYLSIKWAAAQFHTDATRDGEKKYDLGPVQKDKWLDFVYHANFSYKSDGLFQVWLNGQLVVDHKGPNCYNDPKVPYLKYGIYKRQWDSVTTKRVIYVDEVRVGNETATYNDVAAVRK